MSIQEDEFLLKATATYAEVSQAVKTFQERIENAAMTALRTELSNIQRAFEVKKDRIKATSKYDVEGPYIEAGLGDDEFYVSVGLWWSLDQKDARPETYAAVYCKEKAFALALSERCTKENFEADPWGNEWYVCSYRPVAVKDARSLDAALLAAARELAPIGKRYREERQKLRTSMSTTL